MDIVEVVEHYGVDLQKRGKLHIGFCPFHNDRNNPNLTVYPHTDSWYCFSCRVGGDVIQFIAMIENVSRSEVMKRFASASIKAKLDQLKKPSTIDFREETNLLISDVCRQYLQKDRRSLPQILKILEKFDAKIRSLESLSYSEGMVMVEKLRAYLYTINKEMNDVKDDLVK